LTGSFPFIPGVFASQPGPLGRFLPPLPDGVIQTWLVEKLEPGAWVIDPFGASPRLLVEATRAGYRVLAAVNNPITRFLIELYADPPSEEELRAALAELAGDQISRERLEPQIRLLYQTECAQCGRMIEAQAFIWERDGKTPISKIYACPNCKDTGERPATANDINRAAQSAASALHRSRALERVAPLSDPDRIYAEEALAIYPPRAIYVLLKLVNRLDVLTSYNKKLACALLLAAFDNANGLWHYPVIRFRPKQLGLPTRYLEKNIWLALEEAVSAWPETLNMTNITHVPVSIWPELPEKGPGICIFEGRLRDLAIQQESESFQIDLIEAMVCAVPRPNQAFWTLSALWAGWLWGQSASAPFKSVLRRRRYDWTWHVIALASAFGSLQPMLTEKTPCLGFIGEAEPGYLSSAVIAGELSGLHLEGLALRSGQGQAQIHWRRQDYQPSHLDEQQCQNLVLKYVVEYLRQRGEPAGYLKVHAAGLVGLAQEHAFNPKSIDSPAEALRRAEEAIENTLSAGRPFTRINASDRSLEVGQWWLDEESLDSMEFELPLADRVEMSLVRSLQAQPGIGFSTLDAAVCRELTGIFTTDIDLIQECLKSYAEEQPVGSGTWRLRNQDEPAERRADIEEIQSLLSGLAGKLGYLPASAFDENDMGIRPPVIWQGLDGAVVYLFYLTASGVLGKIETLVDLIKDQLESVPKCMIVLPGSRAGLVEYKLHHNPYLRAKLETNWTFLKYRHVRWLMDFENLNKTNLDESLNRDPLANRDPQILLL
jgi:hypothetical protein